MEELQGIGANATWVANNILQRAFRDKVDVSPMKLQKLLYFVTCLYQRKTRKRLLSEPFQQWKYGPVCRSVYDEFHVFRGNPIRKYGKDSAGNMYCIDEDNNKELRKVLDFVWGMMRNMSAVALSRITHRKDSAWSKAYEKKELYIDENDMTHDCTFDDVMGLENA